MFRRLCDVSTFMRCFDVYAMFRRLCDVSTFTRCFDVYTMSTSSLSDVYWKTNISSVKVRCFSLMYHLFRSSMVYSFIHVNLELLIYIHLYIIMYNFLQYNDYPMVKNVYKTLSFEKGWWQLTTVQYISSQCLAIPWCYFINTVHHWLSVRLTQFNKTMDYAECNALSIKRYNCIFMTVVLFFYTLYP